MSVTFRRSITPIGILLSNLIVAGGIFAVLNVLPIHAFLLCFHPLTKTILLALGITLVLNIFVSVIRGTSWLKRSQLSIVLLLVLGLSTLWLGSYSYSPLGFSNAKDPLLRGFLVNRQGRINESIAPGEIILLRVGTPAGISVVTDLPDATCLWNSTNGGVLDDPASCDIAYLTPAATYDILHVRIESACRAETIRGQIKVSIFP